MSDNPEGTIRRKVWFSETLALGLGASLLTWGEPDEDGFYTPALTLAATPAPLDVLREALDGVMSRVRLDLVSGGTDQRYSPAEVAVMVRQAVEGTYLAIAATYAEEETP